MMRMARTLKQHVVTFTTGDMQTGVTGGGQSVGLVHDILTVAELVERLVEEAKEARAQFNRKMEG